MNIVSKCLELTGRDEQDLERRIDTFRQAVRARRGSLVDIRWQRPGPSTLHRVSVLYTVPMLYGAASVGF